MEIPDNKNLSKSQPEMLNAYLVVIKQEKADIILSNALLSELAGLVNTMGLKVTGKTIVNLKKPGPRFLIGKGKAEEILNFASESQADCIVFDDELSPSQQRNLEEFTGLCVIDRTEVILEIFAKHASTKEAVLQTSLARMKYSLPRLTRAWTHLSKQKGGTKGTRGEGETQLEVDRRIVLQKIEKIKKELDKIKRHRITQRKKRTSTPVPTGAITGYTNAGKSSLLNAVTGSEAYVDNKLFATLDPTTRKVKLDSGLEILLTDTVGFIRKLPHTLIEAFKSTLEETAVSDFLIHVLDASDPDIENLYNTTISVLKDIGAGDKPIITVFNKTDLCRDFLNLNSLQIRIPDAVFISSQTGEGLPQLLAAVDKLLYRNVSLFYFTIPSNRYDLAALIHRTGKVLSETHEDDKIQIHAQVPERIKNHLKNYLVKG